MSREDPERRLALTKEDLVKLAKRRGYKHPEYWADKVLEWRKKRSQKGIWKNP